MHVRTDIKRRKVIFGSTKRLININGFIAFGSNENESVLFGDRATQQIAGHFDIIEGTSRQRPITKRPIKVVGPRVVRAGERVQSLAC